MLLEAAERTAITPIPAAKLHAFSYLSDVLSPVWNLPHFDGVVLKLDNGPYYPDIQRELDRLVVRGLVEVRKLRYVEGTYEGVRIDGDYSLNFTMNRLSPILSALGCESPEAAIDPRDYEIHCFLVELASALATIPSDQIHIAATVDATYANDQVDTSNIIDFESTNSDDKDLNRSVAATRRFQYFLPEGSSFSPGERLFLYATYLGKRMHG